jgi:signal transduction histidine kinase
LISFSGVNALESGQYGLAFSALVLTLGPSIFGIIIFNMRANIKFEEELNDSIAHDLSHIRGQLWAIRKKIARELHGGLQSKLQVLALKLGSKEINHSDLVKGFYSELEYSILEGLERNRYADLKSYLDDLRDFWSGVSHIEVNVDSSIYETLANDYLQIECIQEVVREAVNNAIKHGKSKEISISLLHTKEKILNLVVVNSHDAQTSQRDAESSLGTTIFKELSSSWNLSVGDKVTTLSVEFALN